MFNRESLIGAAARLGREISERTGPGEKIVSIGMSPAYAIIAADMLSRKRGKPTDFSFMPFSGYFMASPPMGGLFDFKVQEKHKEAVNDPVRESLFRELATARSCDPAAILARGEEGKPTHFYDLIYYGGGAASFLYLLCRWAKELSCLEDMTRHLRVHFYDTNSIEYGPKPGKESHILRLSDIGEIPIKVWPISREDWTALGNVPVENRLVPYWRYTDAPPCAGALQPEGSPSTVKKNLQTLSARMSGLEAPRPDRDPTSSSLSLLFQKITKVCLTPP